MRKLPPSWSHTSTECFELGTMATNTSALCATYETLFLKMMFFCEASVAFDESTSYP